MQPRGLGVPWLRGPGPGEGSALPSLHLPHAQALVPSASELIQGLRGSSDDVSRGPPRPHCAGGTRRMRNRSVSASGWFSWFVTMNGPACPGACDVAARGWEAPSLPPARTQPLTARRACFQHFRKTKVQENGGGGTRNDGVEVRRGVSLVTTTLTVGPLSSRVRTTPPQAPDTQRGGCGGDVTVSRRKPRPRDVGS